MTFIEYIDGLDADQLDGYAKQCGTSALYIKNHLYGRTRIPRQPLLTALWEQSGGHLSRDDILNHFLPRPEDQEASTAAHSPDQAGKAKQAGTADLSST